MSIIGIAPDGRPVKAEPPQDAGSGYFSGYGSAFNVLDRQGEIVDAGAFLRTLPAFRKAGLLTWQHDHARPVAYVLSAVEDTFGLFIRAAWHSTPDAQAARTVVRERLAAGASVGLSIGYSVAKDRYHGRVRHLVDIDLWEIAIALIPANQQALVTVAKGMRRGPAIPLSFAGRRAVTPTDVALAQARALGVRT